MARPRKNPPPQATEIIQHLATLGGEPLGMAAKLGVSLEVFERWLIEFPKFQVAFDIGREMQRQELHACILRAAMEDKTAGNRNAMYLLSTKFGYRENDPLQFNVDNRTVTNVMVLNSAGTDEEWAEKSRRQQAALIASSGVPQAAGSSEPHVMPSDSPMAILKPTPPDYYDAPCWSPKA